VRKNRTIDKSYLKQMTLLFLIIFRTLCHKINKLTAAVAQCCY